MAKKQSQNPMQYRVRSASGTINRYFRKRESAEKYFDEVTAENPDEVVVLIDICSKDILKHHSPSVDVTSSILTSDKPYIYHYKDGKIVKEALEETEDDAENKFIQFFKRLFSRR